MTYPKSADPVPDLESCANEPIRVPGAVQPHGVLLAVSEPDLVVRVASANAESLLGVGVDALLGKRIGDAVDGPLVPDDMEAQVDPDDRSGHFPESTTLTVRGQEKLVDAVLRRRLADSRIPADAFGFLSSYGDDVGPRWRGYRAATARWVDEHPEDGDRVVAAARRTFDVLTRWTAGARVRP